MNENICRKIHPEKGTGDQGLGTGAQLWHRVKRCLTEYAEVREPQCPPPVCRQMREGFSLSGGRIEDFVGAFGMAFPVIPHAK